MTPDPHAPEYERDDERDDQRADHPQRDVEKEAPGSWVADPDGDAPEPNEPA